MPEARPSPAAAGAASASRAPRDACGGPRPRRATKMPSRAPERRAAAGRIRRCAPARVAHRDRNGTPARLTVTEFTALGDARSHITYGEMPTLWAPTYVVTEF